MTHKVKLVTITPDIEKTMLYIARVSSPNQDSEDTRLLNYCIRKKHWSVFEQGSFTMAIETSRALSAQILRHRSFCFSEFSQRYAEVQDNVIYGARRQDNKNRQNSIDDLDADTLEWWDNTQKVLWKQSMAAYKTALGMKISKETARMILPMSTKTKLYMTGNIRSWITYLMVRLDPSTQLEHRVIAQDIWKIFQQELPIVSIALKEQYEVFND